MVKVESLDSSFSKGVKYTTTFVYMAAFWALVDGLTYHSPLEHGMTRFVRETQRGIVKFVVPVVLLSGAYHLSYVAVEKSRGGLRSSTNAVVASAGLGAMYSVLFRDVKMGAFLGITLGSWGWFKEYSDKIYGRS